MDPSSSPDYGPTGDIDIPLKLNIEMNTSPYAVDETIRGFHPVLTPDAGALGPSNNDGGDGASPTSAVDDISDSASSKRSNKSVPSSDVASINPPATAIVKRRRKMRRKKFVNVTREVEYNSAVIGKRRLHGTYQPDSKHNYEVIEFDCIRRLFAQYKRRVFECRHLSRDRGKALVCVNVYMHIT
jgi:hypothetical protein